MKKVLGMAIIVSMVLSIASCAGGSSSSAYPASTVSASNGVSFADKKAYVESEYAGIICNDFRELLPFSDIIGLPLSKLKSAVNASDTWAEETSVWTDLEEIAGISSENVAYTFSDRAFNLKGNTKNNVEDTILSHFIAGAGNMISADLESAQYVYVFTDGSSQQLITDVLMCLTNADVSSSEFGKTVYSSYGNGLVSDADSNGNYDTYLGLISNVDYEEIYDFDHEEGAKYPSCIGGLNYFYTNDDTLVIQVLSVEAYN